jgi:hypothetical protein
VAVVPTKCNSFAATATTPAPLATRSKAAPAPRHQNSLFSPMAFRSVLPNQTAQLVLTMILLPIPVKLAPHIVLLALVSPLVQSARKAITSTQEFVSLLVPYKKLLSIKFARAAILAVSRASTR